MGDVAARFFRIAFDDPHKGFDPVRCGPNRKIAGRVVFFLTVHIRVDNDAGGGPGGGDPTKVPEPSILGALAALGGFGALRKLRKRG